MITRRSIFRALALSPLGVAFGLRREAAVIPLVIRDFSTTRFIFDSDGEFWAPDADGCWQNVEPVGLKQHGPITLTGYWDRA